MSSSVRVTAITALSYARGSKYLFSVDCGSHDSPPWTQMFFVSKRHTISQAGRHGFDPRLPLQLSAVRALGKRPF
jgi:hypothetical protein